MTNRYTYDPFELNPNVFDSRLKNVLPVWEDGAYSECPNLLLEVEAGATIHGTAGIALSQAVAYNWPVDFCFNDIMVTALPDDTVKFIVFRWGYAREKVAEE